MFSQATFQALEMPQDIQALSMSNASGAFSAEQSSSNPATIINNCLIADVNRISDSLNQEEYLWMNPWGVKRFESVVLAKFMMDYSFNGLAEDRLKDDENIAFFTLSSNAFSKLSR